MKNFTLLSFICALAILSGCASLRDSETAPGLGSTLDATTTFYGLEHAGASEMNPLLSWGNPATAALGSIAIKQGVKYVAVNHMHADPFTVDSQVETAGVAAGVWNIGAIASVHPAVALVAAAASAYGYYKYRQHAHTLEMESRYSRRLSTEEQAGPREHDKRNPVTGAQAITP